MADGGLTPGQRLAVHLVNRRGGTVRPVDGGGVVSKPLAADLLAARLPEPPPGNAFAIQLHPFGYQVVLVDT